MFVKRPYPFDYPVISGGGMIQLYRYSLAQRDVRNAILSRLADNVFGQIAPHLEPVSLRRNQILHQPGGQNQRAHFMQSGLAIFTKMMRDGRSTMIGSVGSEGMTMPYLLNGRARSDVECSVYIEGSALAISADALEQLASKIPALSALLRRYDLLMAEQIAQISGCNRLHALEQRCARLLLTVYDSASAQQFSLTQESLAMMLGAQRPHVSAVAAHFQNMDLIQYRHGQIRIANPAGLKLVSCECYEFIREQIGATHQRVNGMER
jgi:CRP-like cAMP-binding protein